MKVFSVSLQNFASYKSLEFNFSNQGLTLIQGPTGAGKSTLCDVIPWCLFGHTAKGGSVDEILTWAGNEPCKGTITLELNGKIFQVMRSRGKPKDNDLLIWEEGGAYRGRDLLDTQKIINTKLGMNYELYLAGAYYHEFSQTAQFFSTTAKNRRVITEQLVDLSLPIKLRDGISEKRKLQTNDLREISSKIAQVQSNVDLLHRLQGAESTKAQNWEINHKHNKAAALEAYEKYESKRDRVISNKCNTCGTRLSDPVHTHDTNPNPFAEKLTALETAVNPHTSATKDYTGEIDNKVLEIQYLEQEVLGLNTTLGDLDALQQVTEDLRSSSIYNTIKFIESNTNQLLTDYFDAELRVEFDTATADKLDVTIYKDGNNCSFTQLSKGQRCLLKLTFGVSVMQTVANHHGLSFNSIFFDEALSGLSEEFKVKTYRLFEKLALSYESVFIVDHSTELKEMFTNSYSVELVNGNSEIAKTQ